jgi:hypothetical protein
MRIACWIPKAVILLLFCCSNVCNERASLLCYTFIECLFHYYFLRHQQTVIYLSFLVINLFIALVITSFNNVFPLNQL